MDIHERQLAVITDASTPIGLEFARLYAQDRFDLVIAADDPAIHQTAWELGELGVRCDAVQCDMASPVLKGQLTAIVAGRPVDALLAITQLGSGQDFAQAGLNEVLKDIQSNIDATVRLVFEMAREMRHRGKGHIIIVGSLDEIMPGILEAVYNCSKAFLDSLSAALSNELKDSGVTVTCLMPCPTGADAKEYASQVTNARRERVSKGNLKLVVGAGNRLHAAMHGTERRFPTRSQRSRPYLLPSKLLQ
jgi:short-subunit dehydrogenase